MAAKKISIMNMMMLAIAMFVSFLGLGCEDDGGLAGTGQFKIYLINGPASYDSVVVVIREVSVHAESQGWIVVNNTTRTFDLLQMMNDAGSLLGETSLEAGRYTQVRLLLDMGSYVVVGGRRRSIMPPTGFETGVNLVRRFQIEANRLNELYVDFDANGSACLCTCCKKFLSALHVYMGHETLVNNAHRRLTAAKGSDRCRCSDRWDHRQQSGQHCRHCASNQS